MRIGSREWYDANPDAPDAMEIAEMEAEMKAEMEEQRRRFEEERKDWTPEDWRKDWERKNQENIDAGYGPLPF